MWRSSPANWQQIQKGLQQQQQMQQAGAAAGGTGDAELARGRAAGNGRAVAANGIYWHSVASNAAATWATGWGWAADAADGAATDQWELLA